MKMWLMVLASTFFIGSLSTGSASAAGLEEPSTLNADSLHAGNTGLGATDPAAGRMDQKNSDIQNPAPAARTGTAEVREPNILDQPGGGWKLASIILGVASAIPIGIGIAFFAVGATQEQSGDVDNRIGLYASGLIALGVGIVPLACSIAFGVVGHNKAKAAEKLEKSEKVSFEPYLAPLPSKKGGDVTLGGAVLGLRGEF